MSGFIQIRCPRCRNVRTECQEGCSGRQRCRQCKIKFCYEIKNGEIIYGEIKRTGRMIRASSPPTLTG